MSGVVQYWVSGAASVSAFVGLLVNLVLSLSVWKLFSGRNSNDVFLSFKALSLGGVSALSPLLSRVLTIIMYHRTGRARGRRPQELTYSYRYATGATDSSIREFILLPCKSARYKN